MMGSGQLVQYWLQKQKQYPAECSHMLECMLRNLSAIEIRERLEFALEEVTLRSHTSELCGWLFMLESYFVNYNLE